MHLTCASAVDIGYLPEFLDAEGRTATRVVQSRIDINSITYRITEEISSARAVHGRCTCVLEAEDPQGKKVAVKLSWQVTTRVSEVDLLELAHTKNVQGVVKIIDWIDLRKLSAGRRSRFSVENHRLLLLEDRYLRIIVLPLCMPLYKVLDLKDFMNACVSLLEAINELYTKARILHRDVSVNNLMVEKDRPSAGVLIDLDLGHKMAEEKNSECAPTSLHRTGTLPFMAMDLLQGDGDYPHYHRHDIESFVYVFFWIIGRYDAGIEVNRKLFQAWCEGSWKSIRADKLAFLAMDYAEFLPTPLYRCDPILDLTFDLRETVNNAHAKRRRYLERQRLSVAPPAQGSNTNNGCDDSPTSSKRREPGEQTFSTSRCFADPPTGSKLQRSSEPEVRQLVYPEDLPDLNYAAIRELMQKALDGLKALS